jgi:hypothetical protein
VRHPLEISPEPQGKVCLAAALAANNDDPAHGKAKRALFAADGSDEALGLDAMMYRHDAANLWNPEITQNASSWAKPVISARDSRD